MPDLEAVAQFLSDGREEPIIGRSAGAHQVHCQGSLRRAHRPDVKIMHLFDTRLIDKE